MRHAVRVTVLDRECGYGHKPLVGFIEELNAALARIPEEYRDSAEIEIESLLGYEDEHHAEFNVRYSRPETDREMADREDCEKAYRDNMIADLECRLAAAKGGK